MHTHPSKEIIGTQGRELKGRTIVLGITGSVAAVRCPDIARTLMRRGAEVYTVMSPMAQKIIHPHLMEWSTGNPVITELTGKVEHVALAGDHSKKADVILVAPATANTINKVTCGIDDTPVTSVASTAFGSNIPIIIVPAMHESMYNHPVLTQNIKKLKEWGVEFVGPRIEEGKAKIAETDHIIHAVLRQLTVNRDFSDLKILVTAGPTLEHIDPIRVITNRSSGKMGVAMATEALNRGAGVTLIYGPGRTSPPSGVRLTSVETTEEMYHAVISELESQKYDVAVAVAAPTDWTLEKPHSQKISTSQLDSVKVKLKPTRKIVDQIKKISPETFLVAFRAEYKLSDEELIESGYKRLLKAHADLIVANDVAGKNAGFGTETNQVFVINKDKKVIHLPLAPKRDIASKIWDIVKSKVKPERPETS